MAAITIEYLGDLRCRVLGPEMLVTDTPRDLQGLGEKISPTDLVAAALGSCILSVLGAKARALKIDIAGATATVEKEMVSPVGMFKKLGVTIHVPQEVLEDHKIRLAQAAHLCPVHKSLHPDVQAPIEFFWGE